MGILNVTPDSFSGDGLLAGGEDWIGRAVAQARGFFADGADLVDLGGESTRPGAQPVGAAEEMARVVPVIERLVAAGLGPVSIDTYKAEVARAALEAGADMVNDVWGLRRDPALAGVVAAHRAPVVLMHNRSRPEAVTSDPRLGGMYLGTEYHDLLEDVKAELRQSIALAHQAGIPDEHILLDPGLGFGKTVAQNLELIDRLEELRTLGYPLVVGPSRKSFIGRTLNLPAGQRLEGTAATVAVAAARGADVVRVHDVAAMARVARMADAIVRRADYKPQPSPD
ncbi:MAG: dihydropteroate synthase [Anaerolineae bacterium]